jgi:MFS family permease
MADTVADASQPWYRSLNATQWKTLFASNLGWMFDGYETFALILTVGVALRSLLDPSLYPQIPAYAGTVIAITLLGWGVGGLIGGILADYIGRRRMMIYAILAYSLMTGLSALAWDWMSFAALRFLVGVAIGSEWSTGASMTAEVWPNHARGKGAGLMQCGLGIGFFLASLVWLFVGAMGPDAWRIMFLLGILPAFVALWIRVGSLNRRCGKRRISSAVPRSTGRRAARCSLSTSTSSPASPSSNCSPTPRFGKSPSWCS